VSYLVRIIFVFKVLQRRKDKRLWTEWLQTLQSIERNPCEWTGPLMQSLKTCHRTKYGHRRKCQVLRVWLASISRGNRHVTRFSPSNKTFPNKLFLVDSQNRILRNATDIQIGKSREYLTDNGTGKCDMLYDTVQNLMSYFFKIILIASLHPCLGLSSFVFLSGFSTEIMYLFLFDSSTPCEGEFQYLHRRPASRRRRRKDNPVLGGYSWASLFPGGIKTGTWPSRLGQSRI
jgi:hypothetical protein